MQQYELHSAQWCNHWRWTSTWPLITSAPLLCCGTCVPSAPALLIVAKVLSTELAMIHCDTSHTTTGSYQATPSDMKVVGKWKHGIGSASTGLHISSTEAVCGQFSHSSGIRWSTPFQEACPTSASSCCTSSRSSRRVCSYHILLVHS